ncbi:MAG: uridine phosphorylase [Acidocella sp. 20-57-95]|nr:MAG: uridine phosphorylase [Acidocella sp. 20-57-95]HQT65757.1 nucleoside phosphorylase [Acidocella sp.]HQU04411.1 nucleoside phosphorylase [Acidocella sp.]
MAFDAATQATPILESKHYGEASVFAAENMIREARRQKNIIHQNIPEICILDPDGDLLRYAQLHGASLCSGWACYHTQMFVLEHGGLRFGLIGNAVGAAFAVLLAEQAFASGCQLLLSLSSAGQITPIADGPYFVLIERALRDEGTSYHYLPPSRYAEASPALIGKITTAARVAGINLYVGASWTTDAPFRETATAIAAARAEGILAVEMEAAALYAFAAARGKRAVCIAQITNQMGQIDGDFEKGAANGAIDALNLLTVAARSVAA